MCQYPAAIFFFPPFDYMPKFCLVPFPTPYRFKPGLEYLRFLSNLYCSPIPPPSPLEKHLFFLWVFGYISLFFLATFGVVSFFLFHDSSLWMQIFCQGFHLASPFSSPLIFPPPKRVHSTVTSFSPPPPPFWFPFLCSTPPLPMVFLDQKPAFLFCFRAVRASTFSLFLPTLMLTRSLCCSHIR